MNVGPVDTQKNLKEETMKVEEENVYEEPKSFTRRNPEARREYELSETKTAWFRQKEKNKKKQ